LSGYWHVSQIEPAFDATQSDFQAIKPLHGMAIMATLGRSQIGDLNLDRGQALLDLGQIGRHGFHFVMDSRELRTQEVQPIASLIAHVRFDPDALDGACKMRLTGSSVQRERLAVRRAQNSPNLAPTTPSG